LLLYALGRTETSKIWSLRLELTVKMMRSFVHNPVPSISEMQNFSLAGFPITKKMWITPVALKPPKEDDIRQALFKAIEGLKRPGEASMGYSEPDLVPVEAEWTGYCSQGHSKKGMSAEQKYAGMMYEVTSAVTILYFHGGAYYLMDPATHRPTTTKLAKYSRGRCLSIRYRLAPQNPFPAQLLDALVAYLNILYPPPGSLHAAILPSQVVFAGDSSGGNLALTCLQTLLEFRRQGLKPVWNGVERDIPLPAGVACNSAWVDITRSMPSCETNAIYDYIPSPSTHPDGMDFPKCPIWPASPPRKNFLAEDEMLCHPLVSPLAVKDWTGSPPMWMCTGQEILADEDRHVAAKVARQGVILQYEEWEGMPHCFAMVLMNTKPSRICFTSCAQFARLCVEASQEVVSRGVRIRAKTWVEEKLDMESVSPYTDEEVERRMRSREIAIEHEKGTDALVTIG
jgi:acetyl esterase/lipase